MNKEIQVSFERELWDVVIASLMLMEKSSGLTQAGDIACALRHDLQRQLGEGIKKVVVNGVLQHES